MNNNFSEILEKIDIIEIIGQYVPLKKRGKNYIGLCPFHAEKTPSFTVSPEKRLWHCFGCGEGGNVFSFLTKIENISFHEAAELIEQKLGISIQISRPKNLTEKDKEKEIYYLLMEDVCKFFQKNIEIVKGYLQERKISNELVRKFRLGYSLNQRASLFNYLVGKGYSPDLLIKSGVVSRAEGKEEYFDWFKNRLIFPIFDIKGRIVGFGGRTMKGEDPKYLNSRESIVFNKGQLLYGLNFSKREIKKTGFVILVEGYMDLLSFFGIGIENVAAPLGTSFTYYQAKVLRPFTDTVVLAFDQDQAGQVASEKAFDILKNWGFKVRFASFGRCKDPDEFIAKQGKEKTIETIKKSLPALQFKLNRIVSKYNLKEPEAKAACISEAAKILASEKNRIVLHEYVKKISELLGVEESLILSEVKKAAFYQGNGKGSKRHIVFKPVSKVVQAEKCLIKLAVESKSALELIRGQLDLEDFTDKSYREIIKKILDGHQGEILENFLDENSEKLLREILLETYPIDHAEKMAKDCLNTLKTHQILHRLSELKEKMRGEKDASSVNALQSEYRKLTEILAKYGR